MLELKRGFFFFHFPAPHQAGNRIDQNGPVHSLDRTEEEGPALPNIWPRFQRECFHTLAGQSWGSGFKSRLLTFLAGVCIFFCYYIIHTCEWMCPTSHWWPVQGVPHLPLKGCWVLTGRHVFGCSLIRRLSALLGWLLFCLTSEVFP